VLLGLAAFGSLLRADSEWRPAGPFGGSAQSVAVDPRNPEVLLAGGRNGLLFRSEDRGRSWQRVSFGKELSGPVQTLRFDAENSRHYMAGISTEDPQSAGLWESTDAGAHWTRTLGVAVESLAAHGSLLAAGTRHGLYLRRPGSEWQRISPSSNSELQDITAVAFDPKDSGSLYAGTPHLPWKTTDGGATWKPITTGMIDDSDVFSIAPDQTRPQRVFASACSGIYASENGGATWRLLNGIPGTSRRTQVIRQDPSEPRTLYAGTTSGLFKSTDSGIKWNRLNSVQINSIAFDPADSQTLYLATEHSGVLVTHDGGATLTPANSGFYSRNVQALAIGTTAWASTVYEGEDGGLFRSVDGARWEASHQLPGKENIRALAAGSGVIYVSSAREIHASRDEGISWTSLHSPSTFEIRAIHLLADGRLAAGTARGLFLLDAAKTFPDTSKTWHQADIGGHLRLPVLTIHSSGAVLIVRTEFGDYVSRDGGVTWKEWNSGPAAGQVYDVAVSCSGDVLMAGSQGLGRFTGTSLRPAPVAGLPDGTINAVAFHPLRCGEAYAAQFGETYISRDGGESWKPLARSEAFLEKLSAGAGRLLAVFRGQGLFYWNFE